VYVKDVGKMCGMYYGEPIVEVEYRLEYNNIVKIYFIKINE
jgi:hypothetical protein